MTLKLVYNVKCIYTKLKLVLVGLFVDILISTRTGGGVTLCVSKAASLPRTLGI